MAEKTVLRLAVTLSFLGVLPALSQEVGLVTIPNTEKVFLPAGTKPVFKEDYENVTALENSTIEILCAAEGEHPIEYEWYDQKEEKISEMSQLPIHVSNITNGSLLVMKKVALSDKGTYTCLARNKHGLSSKIFDLAVLSKDDDTTDLTTSINNVTVTKITSTSVVFRFIVSGPVTKILVKYQESRNTAEYFKEFKYGDVYEIKDLIPAGKYNFTFKTFPSTNHSWSRSKSVVLLPSKPEVIFKNIESGTIKFQWNLNFEARMRGTIDRHEISYYTVQMVGGTSWKPSTCAITVVIPECSGSGYTISGLGSNVFYEIQVRAHTESGYSEPYTQKISFWNY